MVVRALPGDGAATIAATVSSDIATRIRTAATTIWSLDAGSRRVRRDNESIMSARQMVRAAWNPDHYSGFNAKTEEYNYRFLGEKNMLACVMPRIRPKSDARRTVAPAHAPKSGRCATSTWSRRLRGRTGRPARCNRKLSCTWTRKCGSNRTSTNTTRRASSGTTTSGGWPIAIVRFLTRKVAIYPFKREFEVGAVSTDVQTGLATCATCRG